MFNLVDFSHFFRFFGDLEIQDQFHLAYRKDYLMHVYRDMIYFIEWL